MQIGKVKFRERPVFLAPMEDVSDPPFRILCRRFGADLLYTEFVSTGGLLHGADDSLRKLEFSEEERPLAIQIFGGDVEQVRAATPRVDRAGPDIIDINFGCPVKKIVAQNAGAAVLKDLDRMREIAVAVLENTSRPVTVKTRLGWSRQEIQITEVALMLQEIGVQALAVHARTRQQMYRGEADWAWLRRLKKTPGLSIPVIGNGDAITPEKIREMFETTGVDAVMVGRGAIGNPWIFQEARALLDEGEMLSPPKWEERIAVLAEHLQMKCEWLGEFVGVLEMRRMYGGYLRGLSRGSRLRRLLMQETRMDSILEILLNFRENEPDLILPVPDLSAAISTNLS